MRRKLKKEEAIGHTPRIGVCGCGKLDNVAPLVLQASIAFVFVDSEFEAVEVGGSIG